MKRFALIVLTIPLIVLVFMVLGFAVTQVQLSSKDFPKATGKPDWKTLAQEDIPSVVTFDADGDKRITQVWIVSLDGAPYLRTGNTQWFANLERVPELELRIGGVMYLCRTSVIKDRTKAQQAHDAFYAKYARRSDFFRAIGISTDTVIALECSYGS